MCFLLEIISSQRQPLGQHVGLVAVDESVLRGDVDSVPDQVFPCRSHLFLRPAYLLLVSFLGGRDGQVPHSLQGVDDRLEWRGCLSTSYIQEQGWGQIHFAKYNLYWLLVLQTELATGLYNCSNSMYVCLCACDFGPNRTVDGSIVNIA